MLYEPSGFGSQPSNAGETDWPLEYDNCATALGATTGKLTAASSSKVYRKFNIPISLSFRWTARLLRPMSFRISGAEGWLTVTWGNFVVSRLLGSPLPSGRRPKWPASEPVPLAVPVYLRKAAPLAVPSSSSGEGRCQSC